MEILERKHIAPYLDYDLYLYQEEQESKTDKMIGIYRDTIDFENWSPINSKISHYKPALRPLSDLTKEIEVNGEKFIPASKMITHGFHNEFWNNPSINHMYYEDVKRLFEWHFDVFGLIEKNLAIDINTL